MGVYIMIKEFTIAGIKHHIIEKEEIDDGSVYGRYNEVKKEIYIADKINISDEWIDVPEDLKELTLYHELAHVFQCFTGQSFDEKDAQVLANFLYEFKHSKIETD